MTKTKQQLLSAIITETAMAPDFLGMSKDFNTLYKFLKEIEPILNKFGMRLDAVSDSQRKHIYVRILDSNPVVFRYSIEGERTTPGLDTKKTWLIEITHRRTLIYHHTMGGT